MIVTENLERQYFLARLIDKACLIGGRPIEDDYGFSKLQSIIYLLNDDLKKIGINDYNFGSFYLKAKDETLTDDLNFLAHQMLDISPGSRISHDTNKIKASKFKGLEFAVLNMNKRLERIIGKEKLKSIEDSFITHNSMPLDEIMRMAAEKYRSGNTRDTSQES